MSEDQKAGPGITVTIKAFCQALLDEGTLMKKKTPSDLVDPIDVAVDGVEAVAAFCRTA
jgi:hypothetical protein